MADHTDSYHELKMLIVCVISFCDFHALQAEIRPEKIFSPFARRKLPGSDANDLVSEIFSSYKHE